MLFQRRFLGLIICLFFISPSILFADNLLRFKNITVEDGLSSNTILDIAQDEDGRIWFATYSGLTYFDGLNYHVLPILSFSEPNVLPSGKPEDMEVDRHGFIWVLFEGKKLVRLLGNDGKCKLYPFVQSPTNNFLQLNLDDNGNLLIDAGATLWSYDAEKDDFETIKSANYVPKSTFIEQLRIKMKHLVSPADVYSYFQSDNEIWVTTLNHGIFRIRNGDFKNAVNYNTVSPGAAALSSNEVYCVLVDNTGTVWAGTKDHGVNKGITPNNSFHTLDANLLKMPPGAIRALAKDRRERLWIGTYSHGIGVWNGQKTKSIEFRDNDDDKWNWIRCIYQARNGEMWVGSYGGLCQLDPENFQVRYFDSKTGNKQSALTAPRIYSIVEDKNENLFIGEWGGLDYFDRCNGTITRIDNHSELKGANIRKLMLDTNGFLWVGTEIRGVYVIDTTNFRVKTHYLFSEGGLSSNSIFEICEDRNGTVWIGSFGGLNSVNPDGTIQSYPEINSQLPSTLIYRIFPVANGKLWCSTIKGIVQVDVTANNIRAYDQVDGAKVAELSEGAGLMDSTGQIYFGGVDGISFFDPGSIQQNPFTPGIVLESITVNDKERSVPYPYNNAFPIQLSSWKNDLSIKLMTVLSNSPQKSKIAWKLEPGEEQFELAEGPDFEIKLHDLPAGAYTLVVRAANSDGIWSPDKKLVSFVVAKTFWQEFYFMGACLAVIVLVAIILVRSRFAQIKRTNKRLENLVEQRTEKIEKQKIELEKANEILAVKTQKVSAQKDQILAQRDHLLEMYDKQEEMNRLKENFFTNISHDIRTPLSLIYAPVCEILKEPALSPQLKTKLETIYSNTQYMLQLLDQVLDRKKLETGGLEKVLMQGELIQTCGAIVESFQVQAKTNEIKLDFESGVEELNIRFDFGKLKQIVYNILANAMKFTPKGGTINCAIQIEAECFRITIQDTGIGIPEDRKKYIFERYYQIGKSLNEKNQGSGIGLSLVKDFVTLLNGDIRVDSAEGKGSTFTVSFPLKKNEISVLALGSEELENDYPDKLQPIQENTGEGTYERQLEILLVEDNRNLRDYLARYLVQWFRVTAVANGVEALNYLKKNATVTAIVSDWIMPEMDGIELCRAIRRKTRFKRLPFILLTALNDLNNEKEGYFAGIDDFVAKPFDPELLYLKIWRLVQQQQMLAKKLKTESLLEPENKPIETYDDKLLKKMMQVVEKHLAEADFDSSMLADECGMSSMQLYRKLRVLSQMTPSEFICSVRMKRAMQLLANESIRVNEVSDMVGFNDPKYFSRSFTKIAGMSPSSYREQPLRNELAID